LDAAENERIASVVSLWELETKASAGKLDLPDDLTIAFPGGCAGRPSIIAIRSTAC
jgi:PIN domain nuclease of toxin-antitoxin system